MRPCIVIADTDVMLWRDLKKHLSLDGLEIIRVRDKDRALKYCKSRNPVIIIIGSDTKEPSDGLKLVESIRGWNQRTPIILVAKKSSEELAIAALKLGVTDYLKASSPYESMLKSIKRIMADHEIEPRPEEDSDLVGNSDSMQEIKSYLSRIAGVDSTVLITGETGTGKELVAESIHRKSKRATMAFVSVNCAAIPDGLVESELFGYERGAFTGAMTLRRGKFETAQGGTIFLDEIADMSLRAQAKILRTIDGKELYRLGGGKLIPLDVRVAAATNREPERLVNEGRFREDLFYRLNVARIHLPPLRERKEDISGLVKYGISKLNHRFGLDIAGLTDEALNCLIEYQWPGNVRELMNLLEACYTNLPDGRISYMDLPLFFRKRLEETRDLPSTERDRILSALFSVKWNKTEAARKLHWSRMTLYRKIEKYHIPLSSRS